MNFQSKILFYILTVLAFCTAGSLNGYAYQIATCQDLQNIGTSAEPLNGSYVLANDIDCTGSYSWNNGQGFIPIGTGTTQSTAFIGTFNGAGYTISNVYINDSIVNNRSGLGLGLFGDIMSATIQNVNLENIIIKGSSGSDIGGLVGDDWSQSTPSTISNVTVTGKISGFQAGGIIGGVESVNLSQSSFVGSIEGTMVGGLVALVGAASPTIANLDISNSFAHATLVSVTYQLPGTSSSFPPSFTGGLIGYIQATSTSGISLTNSYSASSFSYPAYPALSPPLNIGSFGGLIGYSIHVPISSINVSNCFYDNQYGRENGIPELSSSDPSGLTTAAMTTAATFTNAKWDLLTTWGIQAGVDYPYLQSSQMPSIPTGLAATAVSTSVINLTWSAPTNNAATVSGYNVFRNGVPIITVTNGMAYSDTGLSPATLYRYTVSAYNAAGNNSAQSSAVQATTLSLANETIRASVGTGGTITPSGSVSVDYNASQTFTVAGNGGYNIYQVLVDGVVVYGSNNVPVDSGPKSSLSTEVKPLEQTSFYTYTFNNVIANHTISATFIPIVVTIAASQGANGLMVPDGSVSVNYGANQIFTLKPNAGYLPSLTVDGKVVTLTNNTYTLSDVTESHTLAASFNAIVVSPDGSTLTAGSTGSLATEAGIWTFGSGDAILLNGASAAGGEANLLMVDNGGQLFAEYSGVWYVWNGTKFVLGIPQVTVTVSAGSNGSISPSGSVSVNLAGNQTFNLTPDAGYIAALTVDGTAVTLSNNAYTLSDVTVAHTLVASFSVLPTSAEGATLQAGTAGFLETNAGTWTFGSGGEILLNGKSAGGGYANWLLVYNQYQMYALDGSSWYLWNAATSSFGPVVGDPRNPPSVPGSPVAFAVSPTQINLTWTASTSNVGLQGYKIYSNGVQIGTSTSASYSNTDLTAATTYPYTVLAYDITGNTSAQTSAVSATTPTTTVTPDNTNITPGTGKSLETGAGTWAFGNGDAILLDGVSAAGGLANELEVANSGQLYAEYNGIWYQWIVASDKFTQITGTP